VAAKIYVRNSNQNIRPSFGDFRKLFEILASVSSLDFLVTFCVKTKGKK
jgi:hypothetical protein